MPMASDALSPAAVHNSPQFLEAVPGNADMDSPGGPAQHGARGDAHGGPVGVVGGQRVGDLARALPTQSRRGDVAVGRPRCGAHVPAVGGVQITGGLQMFGDQRGVLVDRFRVTCFDRGGHAAGATRRDPT